MSGMASVANQQKDLISFTRILRPCKYCGKETPHEVRTGPDGSSRVCIRCREQALTEELDQDNTLWPW
jgi:hypothetical protein